MPNKTGGDANVAGIPMRFMLRLAILAMLTVGPLTAASITRISTIGTNGSGDTVYHYVYTLVGDPLLLNQEVEIRFAAGLYGLLSNGLAPTGFDLLLFQPNQPGGADGRYSAVAQVNNLSLSGVFSVDAVFLGTGTPEPQAFFVNQLDAQGGIVTLDLNGVPEPGTWWLGLSGLLAAGIVKAAGRLRQVR